MRPFTLVPLDPLVFGTGKPFSAIPGARLDSDELPPPSTLAGWVRSTSGTDASGRFDTSRLAEILALQVVGPLPLVLGAAGEDSLAVRAPADALRLEREDGGGHIILRLLPLRLERGDAVSEPERVPVGLRRLRRDKPPRKAPAFWRLSTLLRWLESAPDEQDVKADFGVAAPGVESRTHVRLDPATGTAADDASLFATQGRRFEVHVDGEVRRLGIWGATNAPLPDDGLFTLGGEGRLSRLASTTATLPAEPPSSVVESARAGALRAVLLTPAMLGGASWSPPGARVVAQAHGRPDVISGWGFAPPDAGDAGYARARDRRRNGGRPKPVRRAVPAGAVFFLELEGDPDTRERWLRERWARSISDGQDALDGFGLTLFGCWDGELRPLEIPT